MSTQQSQSGFRVGTLAVVGVGLIGGSVAAAARQRGVAERVIGIGRRMERLEPAREAGLIDVCAIDPSAASEADLTVVCTPVDRIVDDVRAVAAAAQGRMLITDGGSVKQSICRRLSRGLPEGVTFVGAHPLAGSEKSGWEHARADLYDGRICVVTPEPGAASDTAVEQTVAFWQALGMRTLQMDPHAHDRSLALTSHLPHVVASALASLLTEREFELAATGFRDTTRIAAGDPDLWTAIFLQNAEPVAAEIDLLIHRLQEFQQSIADGDAEVVRRLLARGKARRDRLS
ncbi:prephenate dehydrogenase [Maioricimonas rarisocia]|uniref:Prephenate dehydrogenase n=1 Tax=Maioricimonas rarisocia TaxID=2528026 RepID=A0A517Z3C8_9PLAN|nr:prephenate dehydrogenase/arogenate dehydrogenase family protein [Maioricimonas rarisocia]QDU37000.1 prephenate dehydrogenase [Maioricimonas rarisocia]